MKKLIIALCVVGLLVGCAGKQTMKDQADASRNAGPDMPKKSTLETADEGMDWAASIIEIIKDADGI